MGWIQRVSSGKDCTCASCSGALRACAQFAHRARIVEPRYRGFAVPFRSPKRITQKAPVKSRFAASDDRCLAEGTAPAHPAPVPCGLALNSRIVRELSNPVIEGSQSHFVRPNV